MKDTIIIYILLLKITLNKNEFYTKIRKLISEEKKKIICSNINNFKIEKEYLSINEYIESLQIKKNNGKQFLTELILNQKIKNLSGFLGDLTIYIFFIILSIIFLIGKNIIYLYLKIIGWIILNILWYKNKLCFKKDLRVGNCKLVLFSFSLILYFGSILSSSFGIVFLNKSKKSIDSSTCSLILFFENFINGEEKNSYPKWSGTNNIYNSFLKTKDFINILI